MHKVRKKINKLPRPKKNALAYGQEADLKDSLLFVMGLFFVYLGTLLIALGFRLAVLSSTIQLICKIFGFILIVAAMVTFIFVIAYMKPINGLNDDTDNSSTNPSTPLQVRMQTVQHGHDSPVNARRLLQKKQRVRQLPNIETYPTQLKSVSSSPRLKDSYAYDNPLKEEKLSSPYYHDSLV